MPDDPTEGPGLLSSRWFWGCGLLSLLLWTALFFWVIG